jgi:hypothetical protein
MGRYQEQSIVRYVRQVKSFQLLHRELNNESQ